MDAGGERFSRHPTNTAVIREVYDGEYSQQCFAAELDHALDAGCMYIIIEPTQLGEETARWIFVGNCLHKIAVISGLGAIAAGFVGQNHPLTYAPLGIISLLCTGLYTASWQFDSCVKYQVERDPKIIARLTLLNQMTAASPVILVRKDDTYRKVVHCSVSLAAAIVCAYGLYNTFM